MSYLVLARKYRPRTFSEVAGQETAMRVLQGALQEDRVGHAYLFCGPRGTGKTTTARILAKAVNCERGPGPTPCGECERCRAIDAGNDVDVIEIDAASNRGVEDMRELRERVAYAPMRARFKVYIVDEVHMLTKEANNALLKTLEEPPGHVKFLFATTEPHKLLDTVRSRCQIVQLSLIHEEVIAAQLASVLEREGVRPGSGVVEELGRRARGSMRDALSLTDQLLALVGAEPTLDDVRRVAGVGGAEFVDRLLTHVESGDRPALLEALGPRPGGEQELVGSLLEHVRGCLLQALCPAESGLLEAEPAERERRAARAARLGVERIRLWLEELLAARERMVQVESHARLVLELTLLELARPEATVPLDDLVRRMVDLERRLEGGTGAAAPRGPRARSAQPTPPAQTGKPAPPAQTGKPASKPQPPQPQKAGSARPPQGRPRPEQRPEQRPEAKAAATSAEPAPAEERRERVEGSDAFTVAVADLFTGRVEEA